MKRERPTPAGAHTPFTMVLAGGGARGFAHAGVLRALEHEGLRPSGLVGVSMGAVVAATYSLREDWYSALLSIDTSGFPREAHSGHDRERLVPRLRDALGRVHAAWNMLTGWGAPESALGAGDVVLDDLFGAKLLEQGRIPVVVCATDLLSGARVEISTGPARDGVYASSALAGILPPFESEGQVLADGVYSDVAPVDVARAMQAPVVIAVDPGQSPGAHEIRNGLQAVMRAMEICHLRHADLRLGEADIVVRPEFPRYVDVLDFDARRTCVAAGVCAVRAVSGQIHALLRAREEAEIPVRPTDDDPSESDRAHRC